MIPLPKLFNNFFVSKIEKIQDELSSKQSGDNPHAYDNDTLSSLEILHPTTEDEIEKTALSRPNKQCQLDPLPTWIINKCIK